MQIGLWKKTLLCDENFIFLMKIHLTKFITLEIWGLLSNLINSTFYAWLYLTVLILSWMVGWVVRWMVGWLVGGWMG